MFDNISERLAYVADKDGVWTAITGMSIVFTALILISVFIAVLPRILKFLAPYLPEETSHHHHAPAPQTSSDDTAVAAGIGYVLHQMKTQEPTKR